MLAAAFVFGGTLALAAELRRRARTVSHELPASTRVWLTVENRTPQLISRGKMLYFNSCAHCHGNDARGDEGPDLHGLEVSDRRIATVVKRGIEGEMPSFAKKHNDADVLALIAYLRTLE